MLTLGLPIRACMNLTNLFVSFPLNANINGDCRSSQSLGHGLSHNHPITRSRHRLNEEVHSVAQRSSLESRFPQSGRCGGFCYPPVFPTASHAPSRSTNLASTTVGNQPNNADAVLPPQQLEYSVTSKGTTHQAHSRRHHTEQDAQGPRLVHSNRLLPPPFRNRAASSDPENHLPRSIGRPGRLWNPTNSTPRLPPAVYTRPARSSRKRRPSTPPPPAIPVNHPTLNVTSIPDDQVATGAGDYPLLTLPEQRQSRHPTPTRSSFQIEGQLSGGNRISLPSSIHHSYDIKRTSDALSEVDPEFGIPKLKLEENSVVKSLHKRDQSVTEKTRMRALSFGLVPAQSTDQATVKVDKGKGKAVMSPPNNDDPARGFSNDLERGPDAYGQRQNRSNISLPDGIGSAISSSNSSIIGDPDQPGLGDEWGPQHPCFPHMNPYVPINSTEYRTTRIIRVRRDWLLAGDLAPTFSNLYPEILDPAGVSEQEFRRVIEKLNGSLLPIFSPYYWRNILDGVLGVLSGWVWEDMGFTNVKTKLNGLEAWIDKWNAEMEKTIGSEEGAIAPKIISLRRTGYMSVRFLTFKNISQGIELIHIQLDFQIPNPEVSISTSEPASRSGPTLPEPVASTAS
ncbi:Golgin subfamily A member 7/ERF4 family-domain-containing protein [Xylariaceae sp. AK1471]|nr:Golgin subfamily A member 7/ERF4 family-domain-containing protein [Xylariaceae sp. AK1471]